MRFDQPGARGWNQPYYRVVCHDLQVDLQETPAVDLVKYVCEEKMSLSPLPVVPILHTALVHLFPGNASRDGDRLYFVPNDELALSYPEDAAYLREKYSSQQQMDSNTDIVAGLQSDNPRTVAQAKECLLHSWLADQGEEAQELLVAAVELRDDGRLDESIQALRVLTGQYTCEQWPEAHNQLALALLARGHTDAAAVLFSDVLKCKPLHFSALEAVADIGRRTEDWASAKAAALQLQIIIPHSSCAKDILGIADTHQPIPQFQEEVTEDYRKGGAVDQVPDTWIG